MRILSALTATIAIPFLLLLAGCSACSTQPSNPEQVRQATANATSELKNDTKAVAEGIRDGLKRPSSDHPIDLNTATQSQLTTLPGITDETAKRIVANRPYHSAHDLIDRRLVTSRRVQRHFRSHNCQLESYERLRITAQFQLPLPMQ